MIRPTVHAKARSLVLLGLVLTVLAALPAGAATIPTHDGRDGDGAAATAAAESPPDGLSSEDWSTIRHRISEAEPDDFESGDTSRWSQTVR